MMEDDDADALFTPIAQQPAPALPPPVPLAQVIHPATAPIHNPGYSQYSPALGGFAPAPPQVAPPAVSRTAPPQQANPVHPAAQHHRAVTPVTRPTATVITPQQLQLKLADLLKQILTKEFAAGQQAAQLVGDTAKAEAFGWVLQQLAQRTTNELKDIFTNMPSAISAAEKTAILNKVMSDYKVQEQQLKNSISRPPVAVPQPPPANVGPPPLKKQKTADTEGGDTARATSAAAAAEEDADELKTDVTDISGINLTEEQLLLTPSLRAAVTDAPSTPSPVSTFAVLPVYQKMLRVCRQNGLDGCDPDALGLVLHALYERMVDLLYQAMDTSKQRSDLSERNAECDVVSSNVGPYLAAVHETDERRFKEAELRRKASAALDSNSNNSKVEADAANSIALMMLGVTPRTKPGSTSAANDALSATESSSTGGIAPTGTTASSSSQPQPLSQRRITRKDMLLLMERDPHLRSSRNTHEIFLGIAPRKILEEPLSQTPDVSGDVPPPLPPLS